MAILQMWEAKLNMQGEAGLTFHKMRIGALMTCYPLVISIFSCSKLPEKGGGGTVPKRGQNKHGFNCEESKTKGRFENLFWWLKGSISSQFARIKVNLKLLYFIVWFNERNWFSYLDIARITARIDSVILVDLKALKIWNMYISHPAKMKTNGLIIFLYSHTRNWSMWKPKNSQYNMWKLIVIHQP